MRLNSFVRSSTPHRARVFDGRPAVEHDVVVHLVPPGIGHHARDRMADVRKPPKPPQVLLVHVEVAQEDHVILAAAVSLHADEDVGQGIQFGGRFIRIGVDVHQAERERLLRRHAPNPEPGDHRLPVQQVLWDRPPCRPSPDPPRSGRC